MRGSGLNNGVRLTPAWEAWQALGLSVPMRLVTAKAGEMNWGASATRDPSTDGVRYARHSVGFNADQQQGKQPKSVRPRRVIGMQEGAMT